MENEDTKFIMSVLRLIAEYDMEGSLYWRCDGEYAPIKFFINCNDVFAWGCADSEEITPENLSALKQAIEDCNKIIPNYGPIYGGDLFCARTRKFRPQGAAYPSKKELWPLFDACGPEREVGFGNPYPPGKEVKNG